MSAIGMHTSSTKFQHLPGQSMISAERRGFEKAELNKSTKSFISRCFLLFQNTGFLLNQKF